MTVGANSYGSANGVAAYVTVYTASGVFSTATIPTTSQVETFVDQVSAIVNVALKANGFTVPVSQTDAKAAITGLVEQSCADLCHAAHASGRFFSERALNSNLSAMGQLRKEIYDWVVAQADGLEALGVPRAADASNTIVYRESDNSGETVVPLFERKAFGESAREWDE